MSAVNFYKEYAIEEFGVVVTLSDCIRKVLVLNLGRDTVLTEDYIVVLSLSLQFICHCAIRCMVQSAILKA
jgi:hypothetical protein